MELLTIYFIAFLIGVALILLVMYWANSVERMDMAATLCMVSPEVCKTCGKYYRIVTNSKGLCVKCNEFENYLLSSNEEYFEPEPIKKVKEESKTAKEVLRQIEFTNYVTSWMKYSSKRQLSEHLGISRPTIERMLEGHITDKMWERFKKATSVWNS